MSALHKAEESVMKLRIAVATIFGCMALAACGGNDSEDTMNTDANMTDLNAGMTDLNTTMDTNAAMTDMNVTTDVNATSNMDMNATGNATDTTNTTSNTTNTL
jgi:hypothetical protein